MLWDRILSAAAVVQVIATLLEAGSRVVFIARNRHLGVVDSRVVLPPGVNDTSDVWDLTVAVRRCVELGIQNGTDDSHDTTAMSFAEEDLATTSTYTTIRVYSPSFFRTLRSSYGISETSFLRSMLDTGPFVSFQSNSKGAARVGGHFFFTRDGGFMVKTIKKDEFPTLVEILPKYYAYMMRNGRFSLLNRVCALYEVISTKAGKEERQLLIVTNSVFPAESAMILFRLFDLKGSTLGRTCSPEEREARGTRAVLKDLDLVREGNVSSPDAEASRLVPTGFRIGQRARTALLSQLREDVNFLQNCNVIDYSLLVGVGKRYAGYPGSTLSTVDAGSLSRIPGLYQGEKAVYYFGIIDFLQPYNVKKAIEYTYKSVRYDEAFSCVPPPAYAHRFAAFLERHIS